jgi:hypothetical protein
MAAMDYKTWLAAWRRRNPNHTPGPNDGANLRDLFWTYRFKAGSPIPGSEKRLQEMGLMPRTPAPAPAGGGGGGGDGGGDGGGGQQEKKPPPTNLQFEQSIQAIQGRIDKLPELYNTKRSDLYTDTRKGLLEQGYFDTLATTEAADKTTEGGNVSYKFTYGPDGKLYRQAYMTTQNNLAARGMASGSVLEAAQRDARSQIDTARSSALDGYTRAVNQATGDQKTELAGLGDKLTDTRREYGDWQAGQNVTPPTTTTDPNAAAGSTASNTVSGTTGVTDTTATPNTARRNPNILGRGATRSAAVTQARKAVPGVKLTVKKRGGGKGFVAVRVPKR